MFGLRYYSITLIALLLVVTSQTALAGSIEQATVAVSGFDVVSYHTEKEPMRGSGWFVSEHDGETYLFANEKNKERFDKNPEQYLPAFGGYCAYGVAVGKKFYSDPEAWRIVDGKLYLNLDADIQNKWLKDIPGYIQKADVNWPKIKDKVPSEL
ncbi:hypothetical protein DESUT3_24440 [Desulfuromonas versatilis]|uniref:YHS domain-containing protein n=1 Tax=Desulfuromonas versatilis TaxID=2802975 RepID=A0ABN6DZ58_9BACT|nr:YHS domain-containing (seleno)protein [Desulfuromonas versatilis]BCR05375.1 hypothetical protein DESUT3_24440 [Desulfuromonas versatilis]